MRDFSGKTVWITGASSGIGEALAYAMARKGARLILSARNEKELERVRQACVNVAQHQIVRMDLEAYEGTDLTFDMGVTYQVERYQLDAGVNIGLSDQADDLNPFFGLSGRI